MKAAIVGSRGFGYFDLTPYLPENITEIISGGARGVDTIAREYALSHGIKFTEIRPDYSFGQAGPLIRNIEIIKSADKVFIFWDGQSPGSRHVIKNCQKMGVAHEVFLPVDTRDFGPGSTDINKLLN